MLPPIEPGAERGVLVGPVVSVGNGVSDGTIGISTVGEGVIAGSPPEGVTGEVTGTGSVDWVIATRVDSTLVARIPGS
jgi:hypothetical protein